MKWRTVNDDTHKETKCPNRDYCPPDIAAHVLLKPNFTATELISLPRAEYERLIRTEESFTRICNLLTDKDLSPFTVCEAARIMFSEYIPVTISQDAPSPEPDTNKSAPEKKDGDTDA